MSVINPETVEETLKSIYYNPKYGLTSSANLYRKAKMRNPLVTMTLAKEFIDKQGTHQQFATQVKSPYFPLISFANFRRCQMDLIDMSAESKTNGDKWIFALIDCFTKVVFCVPMKTKNKTDVYNAFGKVLSEMEEEYKQKPQVIDVDNEPSINATRFKKRCEDMDIELHFCDVGDKKSTSIIERFNRTLRNLIERYKVSHNTKLWVDALPDLVYNYNHSVNRSLKREPVEAVENNDDYLYQQQKQVEVASAAKYNRSNIVVGSKVRLRIVRGVFEKLTKPKFTKIIHTVTSVDKGLGGVRYTVNDRELTYRKADLLLVDGDVQNNPVLDEKEEKDDSENEVEEVDEERERRIERRLAREGIAPHQYSGDPNNSLEYKQRKEIEALKTRLRQRF